MEKERRIKITDLPLATFLKLQGCILIAVQPHPQKHGKGIFIFESSQRLSDLITDFYARDSQVEPSEFLNTLRQLKWEVQEVLG